MYKIQYSINGSEYDNQVDENLNIMLFNSWDLAKEWINDTKILHDGGDYTYSIVDAEHIKIVKVV